MKSTEFCSAVVKSGRVHFGCLKPSTTVAGKRGFCAEHAPAFTPFYVYRVDRDGSVEKVLVFQMPGNQRSFQVVSPRDRKYGSTLWSPQWHRSVRAARNVPLTEAREAVLTAKRDLARRERELRAIRRAR